LPGGSTTNPPTYFCCDLLGAVAVGDAIYDQLVSVAAKHQRRATFALPALNHQPRFEVDQHHIGIPLPRVGNDQPLVGNR